MLILDKLTFAHQGQEHAYSFSLAAEPGTITAVTGASGAGKSTLLDLIAGFLAPTGGSMTLDSRELSGQKPEDRPVSILFQSEMLFEHLTAAANVALGLPRAHRKQTFERVASALAAVGLPGLGDQVAATLSGGQKQRVALARTLLRDKPILLLDEPFSALDDVTRTAARDLVRDLTRQHGWHTLLVTHHGEDVEALASRRYRIESGRLVG